MTPMRLKSDHRDGDALSSTIMSIIVIQPLMVAICTSSMEESFTQAIPEAEMDWKEFPNR
jgi:hypothetical protein